MKDDRSLSRNQGATASGAASSSSTGQEDGDGGGASTEDAPPKTWLHDYKSGMEYEVYSLALHVAEESYLWGLTFSRWAGRGGQGGGCSSMFPFVRLICVVRCVFLLDLI